MSKFKPRTDEKNLSTTDPPAGIVPTPCVMPVHRSSPKGVQGRFLLEDLWLMNSSQFFPA